MTTIHSNATINVVQYNKRVLSCIDVTTSWKSDTDLLLLVNDAHFYRDTMWCSDIYILTIILIHGSRKKEKVLILTWFFFNANSMEITCITDISKLLWGHELKVFSDFKFLGYFFGTLLSKRNKTSIYAFAFRMIQWNDYTDIVLKLVLLF